MRKSPDTVISLEDFNEPMVAEPVCVRLEPGSMQSEELSTCHMHARVRWISLASDGTVRLTLADGRVLTVGLSQYVTYSQTCIDAAHYTDGCWWLPGQTAGHMADDIATSIPLDWDELDDEPPDIEFPIPLSSAQYCPDCEHKRDRD